MITEGSDSRDKDIKVKGRIILSSPCCMPIPTSYKSTHIGPWIEY